MSLSFSRSQFLRHEMVLVSEAVIFERSNYPIPELFVKLHVVFFLASFALHL
jgi:hypothetical protein